MLFELADLTTNQFDFYHKYIFNGLGSRESWINPRDFIFRPAALHHDFWGIRGGPDALRVKADSDFYTKCKELADQEIWIKRIFYRSVAWVYYQALVQLSQIAWEYHDEPAKNWAEFIGNFKFYYARNGKAIPDYMIDAEKIT